MQKRWSAHTDSNGEALPFYMEKVNKNVKINLLFMIESFKFVLEK